MSDPIRGGRSSRPGLYARDSVDNESGSSRAGRVNSRMKKSSKMPLFEEYSSSSFRGPPARQRHHSDASGGGTARKPVSHSSSPSVGNFRSHGGSGGLSPGASPGKAMVPPPSPAGRSRGGSPLIRPPSAFDNYESISAFSSPSPTSVMQRSPASGSALSLGGGDDISLASPKPRKPSPSIIGTPGTPGTPGALGIPSSPGTPRKQKFTKPDEPPAPNSNIDSYLDELLGPVNNNDKEYDDDGFSWGDTMSRSTARSGASSKAKKAKTRKHSKDKDSTVGDHRDDGDVSRTSRLSKAQKSKNTSSSRQEHGGADAEADEEVPSVEGREQESISLNDEGASYFGDGDTSEPGAALGAEDDLGEGNGGRYTANGSSGGLRRTSSGLKSSRRRRRKGADRYTSSRGRKKLGFKAAIQPLFTWFAETSTDMLQWGSDPATSRRVRRKRTKQTRGFGFKSKWSDSSNGGEEEEDELTTYSSSEDSYDDEYLDESDLDLEEDTEIGEDDSFHDNADRKQRRRGGSGRSPRRYGKEGKLRRSLEERLQQMRASLLLLIGALLLYSGLQVTSMLAHNRKQLIKMRETAPHSPALTMGELENTYPNTFGDDMFEQQPGEGEEQPQERDAVSRPVHRPVAGEQYEVLTSDGKDTSFEHRPVAVQDSEASLQDMAAQQQEQQPPVDQVPPPAEPAAPPAEGAAPPAEGAAPPAEGAAPPAEGAAPPAEGAAPPAEGAAPPAEGAAPPAEGAAPPAEGAAPPAEGAAPPAEGAAPPAEGAAPPAQPAEGAAPGEGAAVPAVPVEKVKITAGMTKEQLKNSRLRANRLYGNLADISAKMTPKDTPFFWHIPKSGGSSFKDIFSVCLSLTVSCEVGAQFKGQEREVSVFNAYGNSYVNVDTTTSDGIVEAAKMGLAPSGLSDVIVGSHVQEFNNMFTPEHKGKMFVVLRDPLDRAVSMFYYLAIAHWEPTYEPAYANITLAEYARGKRAENNWMTRFLCNERREELTPHHLELAKTVLRKKFIIGLLHEPEESFRRFQQYFGWSLDDMDRQEERRDCVKGLLTGGTNRNKKSKPKLEEGSEAHIVLTKKNLYDIELYDYALELFENQAKMFKEKKHVL